MTNKQIVQYILALNGIGSITVWWNSDEKITSMSDHRLIHTRNMLLRTNCPKGAAIFQCALDEFNGRERYDFLDLCMEYNKNPETNMLRIQFNLINAN